VEGKSATLYAGGGLLSSSELEDEWMETERKMATMKRVIRIE
jgi:isochorismate synthase